MAKFRKKPVIIEAQQFTSEMKDRVYVWATQKQQNITHDWDKDSKPVLKIPTLEGVMTASLNDYIIVGIEGEVYPCKPVIFEKSY